MSKIQIFKLLAALIFLAANALAQTAASQTQTIPPNKKIERDLRGGETISFQIKVAKGDFVEARVDQKGVDVLVKVFAPGGVEELFERDTPNGEFGAEDISFVAAQDGVYRLEIAPLDQNAPAGKFAVELENPRAPHEKDLLRVKADVVFAEALRLRQKNTPEANKQAQSKYEEAVKDFQILGDKYREANALASLAFVALDAGGAGDKSLQMINRALELAREIADKHLEKLALANLGDFYSQTKDGGKALEFYNQAFVAAKNLGDESVEISALLGVGSLNYAAKEWKKSIDAFLKVLELQRARGDRNGQAQTLNSLGVLYDAADDRKQAVVYYEKAAALYGELKNVERQAQMTEYAALGYYGLKEPEKSIAAYGRAAILRAGDAEKSAENLGEAASIYGEQKNWKEAAAVRLEMLALYRAAKNQEKIAATLNLVGVCFVENNERRRAIAFYDEALKIYRSLKKECDEITILENIASNYSELKDAAKADANYRAAAKIYQTLGETANAGGDLEKLALHYKSLGDIKKAVAVYEEIPALYLQSKDKKGEGVFLNRIGVLYSGINNRRKAQDYYQKALKLTIAEGDKTMEAQTRHNIGAELSVGGRHTEAVAEFQKALALRRELKLKIAQGETLTRLAEEYGDLLDYEKSFDAANEALSIFRQEKSRADEADALITLAGVYTDRKEFQTANRTLEDALKIARELKDKQQEANALHGLSVNFDHLNDFPASLEYDRRAEKLYRETGDQFGVVAALDGIGKIYEELGEHKKSLEIFAQILDIARNIGDREREALTLARTGGAYLSLGVEPDALKFSLLALPIAREVGDKSTELTTLINIGVIYTLQNDYASAKKYIEQSFLLSREVGDIGKQATALETLALNSYLADDYEKAFDYLQQSLLLARSAGKKSLESGILKNLMILQEVSGNRQEAIFYGKLSVNIKQQLRGALKGIDKELQQSYLKENEDAYRRLADLLISDGRIPEAQAVLDLLKDEELGKILQRGGEPLFVLPYSKAETDAMTLIDRLAASGREIAELNANQKTRALTAAETERLNQLQTAEIPAANKALRAAMQSLATAAPDVERALQAKMKDNVQNILPDLGGNVAALYTVFGQTAGLSDKDKQDVGWIILVTPEFRKAYPIDTNNLNETVSKFRDVLRSPQFDPQPLAQELYKKLFVQTSDKQKRTLAADLDTYFGKSKDRTLMWSLDGVLRYVPMAALHDGNNYLVEKYRNVVFNTASLGSLKDAPKASWEVLGFGVSEAKTVTTDDGGTMNFAALTGAESELKSLVKNNGANASAILPGTIRLNKDFTKQSLISSLREGKPVVHIASHFAFNTANEESSFLLLGDGGKLEMSEFEDFPNLFAGVDLLSLSACDTATGGAASGKSNESNGKEVEGFAYVAQTLGAKSVMASLWQVSDEGTKELMLNFYAIRQKNPQTPKGEALREAQLILLKGNSKIAGTSANRRSDSVNLSGENTAQPKFVKDPNAPFAHPFYWSPFILIGNWR